MRGSDEIYACLLKNAGLQSTPSLQVSFGWFRAFCLSRGCVTGTLGSGGATFILWGESRWEGAGRRVSPGQGQSCSFGTECRCMLEQGDKLFELQSSLVTWLRRAKCREKSFRGALRSGGATREKSCSRCPIPNSILPIRGVAGLVLPPFGGLFIFCCPFLVLDGFQGSSILIWEAAELALPCAR